jgi:hypothetical protein
MTIDEVKRQFVEQVKLRAYDDKYIDKDEEREILQIALQAGVTVDSARAALAQVCEQNGYIIESKVIAEIKNLIDTFAGNDGQVDEKEFNDTVTMTKKAVQGKKNDREVKRMVVQVMEDAAVKVKTGWFSDWYTKVKKEVGMA